jgi:uncharacterized protein (TIGR00296 family)
MLSLEEARDLIALGRRSVISVLEGEDLEVEEDIKDRFGQNRGVFVTLLTYPDHRLRGCVGIPFPLYPLWRGVMEASVGAAFRDPRFEPLRREELNAVIWELSVLSEPHEVPKECVPEDIRVGEHGLMVEKGSVRGLLLPQVPVKQGWDAEEFLRNTCLKAGLDPDCWRKEDVKIYKFTTEIYEEVSPWGEVRRVNPRTCG